MVSLSNQAFSAVPSVIQAITRRGRGRLPLPPTRVRSTVDVEYLPGDLACVREVDNGVNDITDARDLSHRLQGPEKLFRIILVQWCVDDSGSHCVEPNSFLGILDG